MRYLATSLFAAALAALPAGAAARDFDGRLTRGEAALIERLRAPRISAPDPKDAGPRVAVVGAGLAGMTAAYELAKRGIVSDVYEARGRVGGRTWTENGEELGGSFINSTDAALRGLIKELGLRETAPSEREGAKYLVRDGRGGHEVVDQDAVYGKFEREIDAIRAEQERLGIVDSDLPERTTRAIRSLNGRTIADYLDSIRASDGFRDFVQAYYGGDFGKKLGELSALHVVTELIIDPAARSAKFYDQVYADEALAVEGGNQQVTLEIERRLGGVRKNRVLTRIEENGAGGFVLTFRTPFGHNTVEADYVVLTPPFSVLRESVEMKVSLPKATRRLIEETVQGRNSKMILEFRTPVWSARYGHSGMVLASDFQTWSAGGKALTVYFNVEQSFSDPDGLRRKVLAMLEPVYPGISAECEGMRIADWPADPFSRGSFSGAKAPGQYLDGYPDAASVRAGNLIFAGEHVAGDDMGLVGYMNGAVQSGIDAAGLVAEAIRARERAPRRREESRR